jgi:hypothetical protein
MKKEKKQPRGVTNPFNDKGFEEALKSAIPPPPPPNPQPPKLEKKDLFGNDVMQDLENLMKSLNIEDKLKNIKGDKNIGKTLLDIIDLDNEHNILEEFADSNFIHYKLTILKKKADPSALILNGFDNALIGTTYDGRLVYDKDIMYKIIVRTMDCDGDDATINADEYLDTICSQDYGRLSPIFISLNMELVFNTLK